MQYVYGTTLLRWNKRIAAVMEFCKILFPRKDKLSNKTKQEIVLCEIY